MKKIKILSILLFLAILSPVFVKADNVYYSAVGYGYTQSEHQIGLTWVTYSPNNLVRYNYELPNGEQVEITEFDFRFSLGSGNQFKKGYNYILNFDWWNGDEDSGVFSVYYNRMIHSLSCRKDNWNTTNEYGTDCFITESIDIEQDTTSSGLIHVTLRFTPIKDFFGLTFQNRHDGQIYENYPSDGWEVYNISYFVVEDGTQSIINNQNQNTQNIINNQDSNTSDIINNQNQNTQDIIDNQNANSQAQIDSQRVCKYINKNNVVGPRKRGLNANGEVYETGSNEFAVTDYINIVGGTLSVESLYGPTNALHYCFYDNNKVKISCATLGSLVVGSLTIPNNAVYFRSSIYTSTDVPLYKLCQNGNQAIGNSINDLNSSINDSSAPDTSGLSNATGWLPPGPVDSILNLPLTLLQSLNNAFSSNSCQPLVIHFPHISSSVPIPCMSTVWQNFGLLSLFTWIGRVIGGILLYKYLINLYKWVDDTLTMRENNNFDDGSLG